jgi:hypothetical protein
VQSDGQDLSGSHHGLILRFDEVQVRVRNER